MIYSITLLNVPNQSLTCNLTNKNGTVYICDINLRTLSNKTLSADIAIDGKLLRYGVVCNNKMPLISTNTDIGNIYFKDMYGNENPYYEKFNERFILVYDTEFKIG